MKSQTQNGTQIAADNGGEAFAGGAWAVRMGFLP
jgi:hypothetical protein